MPRTKKETIKDKPIVKVKEKFREQTIGYITAAFGLVAGLAWNDAVKSMIERVFIFGSSTIWAKFFYAIFITVILVFVTMYLNHLLSPKEKK
ncbi:MAG: DUF5654 family protein [Candidatus Paceibacterota bacterium]|jgi:hypothetical protein